MLLSIGRDVCIDIQMEKVHMVVQVKKCSELSMILARSPMILLAMELTDMIIKS